MDARSDKPPVLQARLKPPSRWLPIVATVAVGLAVSLTAYRVADRADDKRIRGIVEIRAEWRARDLEAKMKEFIAPLNAVAVFVSSRQRLDLFSFRRFASEARGPDDPIRTVIWAPHVTGEERPEFEAAQRLDGFPDYRIVDRDAQGEIVPAAPRDGYFPALFERAYNDYSSRGLDLTYDERRRSAALRARDEGRPVSTLPLRMPALIGQDSLYLIFCPIYRTAGVPPTIEERRADLRGFTVGVFKVADTLSAAVRHTPEINETIHFAMLTQNGAEAEPVATFAPSQGGIVPTKDALGPPPAGGIRLEHFFNALGQDWRVTSDFGPEILSGLGSTAPLAWLFAGLLLTALTSLFIFRERQRVVATEAIVVQRTTELTRANESLARSQKMEALGQLTGGIAHDFNNLLGVIIGNLDLLSETIPPGSAATELSNEALGAALRGGELVRRLLAFSRRQPLQPKVVQLAEVIDNILPLVRRTIGEQIRIETDLANSVGPVNIDPVQLETAILNLAINARDAMPNGGRLQISCDRVTLDEAFGESLRDLAAGDYAVVSITDTGTGMAPEVLERVFEPFFTTKAAGSGTGLGLSMVYGFMKQSGGSIQVYSEPGHGTSVRLYLPPVALPAELLAAAAPAPSGDEPHGTERILVVEDRPDMRKVATSILANLGYRFIEAENADDALALIDAGEHFDLLFSDVIMPGTMNGVELARALRQRDPAARVLFSSGFSSPTMAQSMVAEFGAPLILKPYRRGELARLLRKLLDAPGP